jgi:hypothetical protein
MTLDKFFPITFVTELDLRIDFSFPVFGLFFLAFDFFRPFCDFGEFGIDSDPDVVGGFALLSETRRFDAW